jgi:hypothetical protein
LKPSIKAYLRAPFERRGYQKIIWGLGLWVTLLPPIGWMLGVGYRLRFLRETPGDEAYPPVAPLRPLFQDGAKTALLILFYTAPGLLLGLLGILGFSLWFFGGASLFFSAGIFLMPAAMMRVLENNRFSDGLQIRRVLLCIRERRLEYLAAWRVSLLAVGASLLMIPMGYILFGPATIWAWLVVGEAFEDALVANK